ncbi:MAG TPA: hypothetical protein VFV19_05345 [Candidatus Polarisedimenticolaceae bacterium]|nr:hypothetical protein [Candidatus Polarisedimenticolaceae bacterium]
MTTLVDAIAGSLRRTYALRAPLLPVGRYVIGDAGFKTLYGEHLAVARSEGEGGRLLLRESGPGLRACIYFPDAMIRHLEAHPPQRALTDRNVDAFAVLVEEIDHLLVAAERFHEGRPVTLLELELQANVSKDLVLSHVLARQRPDAGAGRRVWLRHHLFHKREYREEHESPGTKARYDDAARFAIRFLRGLEREPAGRRLETLRRFHRAPLSAKLAMIED